MRKFILLFFIANITYSQSTLILNSSKSKINYKAKHFLNSWKGSNNEVSGAIIYDEGISNIAVATKVIDFESGNSNRDLHLLEYLNVLKHPYIKFYSDDISIQGNAITFNGDIEFHGQKKPIEVLGTFNDNDDLISITGKFQIVPTKFSIKLPSFMLIEMEDYLNISFDFQFDK